MTRLDAPLNLEHDLPTEYVDGRADALATLLAPSRTASRDRVRRRWLPAGAGAVALLATALVVASLVTGGTTRSPLHEPSAAAAMLRRAAISATGGLDPKLGAGDYWMTHVTTSSVEYDFHLRFKVTSDNDLQLWTDRNGDGYKINKPVAPRPTGPADERAWNRQGKPDLTASYGGGISPIFGTRGGAGYRTITPSGERRVFPFQLSGRYLSYSQVRALPTDPDELYRRIAVASIDSTSPADQSFLTFIAVTEALAETPLSPRQRAGLFRVLAKIPGVRYDGVHRDGIGRLGSRVSFVRRGPGNLMTIRTTFDARTSTILQLDSILSARVVDEGGHGGQGLSLRTTFVKSEVTKRPEHANRLTFTAPGSVTYH